mgnify:CR=1 FL=1
MKPIVILGIFNADTTYRADRLPKIGETIYDPAAGTAGFLVAAYNHIRLANSSPGGIQTVEVDGKQQTRGLGDKLSAAQVSALQNRTFFGNDVDPKMVRLQAWLR